MEFTLSTHLLVYDELGNQALEALAGSGYLKLEVWLAEPHVPWRSAEGLASFKTRLDDYGLSAGSVHLPFYPSVPELIEENARWSLIADTKHDRMTALQGSADGLMAAGALGAECGVLHLGWQKDVWNDHSDGWAREAVAELVPIARKAGVRLLLENIISSGTRVSRLMKLLDEVDPDHEVGLCVDLGHAHVEGHVVEELQTALPRLHHLHVHDNDGCTDAHLAPGQGTIPWTEVLQTLQRAGFDGLAALEMRDYSRGELDSAATLAHSLQQVADFRMQYLHKGLQS
ncbi:MAG: sugar phosphate isomerase/epimerase [Planctomycetota bacterium]|nr:sugar phosphate isomerase/epimerase [Planctomycetota bacterium]MDA1114467.1 sugar phosphate isomerase/epimerase [Planctomycetota bacterium]